MDLHGTDKQQINYMQQINKITPPFYEILALLFWRMLGRPRHADQTQQILDDLFKGYMDI